ncbi:MAG: NAD(P)(+) transhydrogenase (Re/Si-specific) subunit beta [Alphaproteobacteria bacterium]|nr:NAD(P)(+) transhydrogenase (Re/Si-specific) subunit beta [Alphaproteobacteria bacterium]
MNIFEIAQLISSVLFILALRGLSSASTAIRGNQYGIAGMALIAIAHFAMSSFNLSASTYTISAILIAGTIGYIIAKKINMTALPQLVAAFHSLIGLAAVFIACAIFSSPEMFDIITTEDMMPILNSVELSLGTAIGAITFTGSIVAFAKLSGLIKGTHRFKHQNKINLLIGILILFSTLMFVNIQDIASLGAIILLSFALGYFMIMPIGGADMPVVVSMLNSYSGWAAAGIGFTLDNNVLIIVGALVGTSGAILSDIMCKAMNRSLISVIFGNGSKEQVSQKKEEKGNVKVCAPEDAGFILRNSESVIIVPGYGMAVAQAQHTLKELADILKSNGTTVRYAIHPVAGRMPGHMNVLLAEANIPYEDVFELDEINHDFGATDAVIVVGANDITNPAAKNDPTSPIYGMPILDVEKAKVVLFIKRSLASGYAGIDNSLFYQANTMMVLGDAKKVVENIVKEIS